MTNAEFRDALDRLGHSQSAFARKMATLGDPRPVRTILRSISNYCTGGRAVPGEMSVILTLLEPSRAAPPGPH